MTRRSTPPRATRAALALVVAGLGAGCADPSAPRAAASADGAPAGTLVVAVAGLPDSLAARVRVTPLARGPPTVVSPRPGAPASVDGLRAGRYAVAGDRVTTLGNVYTPALGADTVDVRAATPTTRTVAYDRQMGDDDFAIDGVEVVQAVQTPANAVPLVAGRHAVVRVYVRSARPTRARPLVAVRLVAADGTATALDAAPSAWSAGDTLASTVPLAPSAGRLDWSWNVALPPALVQPGARLAATVNPGGDWPERDPANNRVPADGTLSLDVRRVAPVSIVLVPITTRADGRTGDVHDGNVEDYVTEARAMWPVSDFRVRVRATPLVTDAPPLDPRDANGAWVRIVDEIRALQAAEGGDAAYVGVVPNPAYSADSVRGAGLQGIGYVGGTAAVVMDRRSRRAYFTAHEIGHLLGLRHAPCGGATNADPAFPQADGSIGAFGLDQRAARLRPPSTPDVMGYCGVDDGDTWVSGYDVRRVLDLRGAGAARPRPPALVLDAF